MNSIASFHLATWPGALGALARLGTDRLRLKHVEGLVFWRLLGTGSGNNTSQGANLKRTAFFAVWQNEQCLQQFLDHHPIAQRWKRADESWHVKLRGVGGQPQVGLDLFGYFQTEIDGITAGFVGCLITEGREVRQVAESESMTRADALERIALCHYR